MVQRRTLIIAALVLAVALGGGLFSISNPVQVKFTYVATGLTVQFNAQGMYGTCNANPGFTYAWTFGDASTGVGATPTHTYLVEGTYAVSVTATNGCSQSGSTSKNVVVQSTGGPLAVFWTATMGSPITKFSFATSVGGGTAPYTFAWDFGDGSTGTGASTSHTYSTGGTYTVVVTVTDSAAATASYSNALTVTSNVQATFNYKPVGDGLTIDFTSAVSGGNGVYAYAWDFGDGGTSSDVNPSHTYVAGTYLVSLTVTSGGGTAIAGPTSITVRSGAGGALVAVVSPTVDHLSASFANGASGGTAPYTYAWDFGDGATSTDAAPTHAYAKAATFTVKVTVHDSVSHSATASASITTTFPPISVAFNWSANDRTLTVVTMGAMGGSGSGYVYTWTFGDANGTGAGLTTTHKYATDGSYLVTLKVSDSAGNNGTASATITVKLGQKGGGGSGGLSLAAEILIGVFGGIGVVVAALGVATHRKWMVVLGVVLLIVAMLFLAGVIPVGAILGG